MKLIAKKWIGTVRLEKCFNLVLMRDFLKNDNLYCFDIKVPQIA